MKTKMSGCENDIGTAETDKKASQANATRHEADGIDITLKLLIDNSHSTHEQGPGWGTWIYNA